MRGLKPRCCYRTLYVDVASFTDAWIETTPAPTTRYVKTVASFTDAWIETYK